MLLTASTSRVRRAALMASSGTALLCVAGGWLVPAHTTTHLAVSDQVRLSSMAVPLTPADAIGGPSGANTTNSNNGGATAGAPQRKVYRQVATQARKVAELADKAAKPATGVMPPIHANPGSGSMKTPSHNKSAEHAASADANHVESLVVKIFHRIFDLFKF